MAGLAEGAGAGGLTPEQAALVSSFCEMTMADRRTGAHYLFTLGAGTLDAAVSLYFECGGAPAPVEDPAPAPDGASGGNSTGPGSTKNADGSELVDAAPLVANFTSTAPESQFSYPEGRSACTTIAVEACHTLLTETGDAVTETTFGDPSILLGVLTRGIAETKTSTLAIRWSIWRAEVLLLSEKYKVLEHVLIAGTTEGPTLSPS